MTNLENGEMVYDAISYIQQSFSFSLSFKYIYIAILWYEAHFILFFFRLTFLRTLPHSFIAVIVSVV